MPVFSLPMFVEAAARASVILATTGLVAAVLRRSSASARHLVWVLGLTSALVVPALSFVAPRVEVPIVRLAAPAAASAPRPVSLIAASPVVDAAPAAAAGDVPAAPASRPEKRDAAWTIRDLSTSTILLAIWALGAALVLGRMLLGLVAVQWISRRSRIVTGGPWLDLAEGLAADLGLRRVRFVQGAMAAMPMAFGVFRASVLMPAGADTWPAHRLRVVLLHELAHVKRRDCLTHLVAQIVCAVHWFNPLAWMAARRLRAERERACDDLVLAAGTRGSDYADELLDIARVMQSQRFPVVLGGASLAMAHRSQLEGRLMAILDPSVPRRGLTRARIATAATVFAILMLSVASVQPWAEAPTPATGPDAAQPQVSTKAIELSQSQARNEVQTVVQSTVQGTVQGTIHGTAQGTVHGTVHGAVSGSMVGAIAEAASVAGEKFGTVVGNAVGGAVLDVVSSVAGLEQARPNPNPNPNPNPRPNPNPNPNPNWNSNSNANWNGEHGEQAKADPRAVAALMEALKDTDKEVRETAMHALVQMRDPRIFEPLVAALKDASPDVREQAAFGLGQLRDHRAVEPLTSVLHDQTPDVRQQAVFALGQIRDPKSVEPLISALKDENADVREQAAFALGQIRDAKAVEALVVALKDGNADVREQVVFALGQIRDPRAIDGLTAALKDSNADVRKQAAFALGQIRY